MKNFILLLSAFLYISSSAQFLKEANLEALSKIDQSNRSDIMSFGFSSDDDIPTSFSLESFAVVSNQGNSSSCTGFAVANGAMTILYNLVNRHTGAHEQLVNRFDPYYIYCSLKDQDDMSCISGGGCSCGSMINEALDLLVNYGCKKLFLFPDLDCGSTLNRNNLRDMSYMTGIYTIDDYVNLFEYKEEDGKYYKRVSIDQMKWCISRRNPITAGIDVDKSFGDLSSLNNKYSAREGFEGRHAVTIVGYDDNKYGGAFRILNSYGSDWGDGGYFWMTYEDFKSQGDVAYVILQENWDAWRDPVTSSSGFYKGIAKDQDWTWEGHLDENRMFDGRGIVVDPDFTAAASFKNGLPHGWWLWFDNPDKDEPWMGWVLFQEGEVTETESLGFSSSDIESAGVLENAFHMENMDMEFSDESATEDDFKLGVLNSLKNSKGVNRYTNK